MIITLIILFLVIFGIVLWFAIRANISYNPVVNFGDVQSTKPGLSPKSTTEYNSNMQIRSSAFENEKEIPSLYTCDSKGINPQLSFSDIPAEAKSLALVVDDPDAPAGVWDHWVVWNITPETKEISENSVPVGAVVGQNSWPQNEYGAPCPPNGTHKYYFKLFALDTVLNIPETSGSKELTNAMQGHVVAQAELMGKYGRK